MSRANRNPSLKTKSLSDVRKTTLIWMHASLFALFMPFTVSAPNVNRDYISLWYIPQGSRKLLSLSPQFSFPAPQTQTEEMWSNFSFVMIFKPKTVLAMANYALVEPKREATFVSRAVAFESIFPPP